MIPTFTTAGPSLGCTLQYSKSSMESLSSSIEPSQESELEINQLAPVEDLTIFTQKIIAAGNPSVILRCGIPTWTGQELNDLHDLRTKSLTIVHSLVQSLRSRNARKFPVLMLPSAHVWQISASYCLAPTNSPQCLICCLPKTSNDIFQPHG
ncbi:hypothetical protein C8J56DRAFT_305598 [Mycena floridula]|nr:hypothetical protein C8J56DRAFT_305598 [Mycena floridula]